MVSDPPIVLYSRRPRQVIAAHILLFFLPHFWGRFPRGYLSHVGHGRWGWGGKRKSNIPEKKTTQAFSSYRIMFPFGAAASGRVAKRTGSVPEEGTAANLLKLPVALATGGHISALPAEEKNARLFRPALFNEHIVVLDLAMRSVR